MWGLSLLATDIINAGNKAYYSPKYQSLDCLVAIDLVQHGDGLLYLVHHDTCVLLLQLWYRIATYSPERQQGMSSRRCFASATSANCPVILHWHRRIHVNLLVGGRFYCRHSKLSVHKTQYFALLVETFKQIASKLAGASADLPFEAMTTFCLACE